MKRLNNNLKKIFIGFMAGVISGLFTAGGGLILVPAFMYMLKIEPKRQGQLLFFAYCQW